MLMSVVLVAIPVAVCWGMALCGLLARVRFVRGDTVFRCKIRLRRGWIPGVPSEWSRRWTYARWADNVLVVQRGVFRPGVMTFVVEVLDGAPRDAPELCHSGLGRLPRALVARLDTGDVIEVVAADTDRMTLTGPFLTAALDGVRQAPVDRP
jgi:hypothetical protein